MQKVTQEETVSGTKLFVNGEFYGWKCNNCLHAGSCENRGKYGECRSDSK